MGEVVKKVKVGGIDEIIKSAISELRLIEYILSNKELFPGIIITEKIEGRMERRKKALTNMISENNREDELNEALNNDKEYKLKDTLAVQMYVNQISNMHESELDNVGMPKEH